MNPPRRPHAWEYRSVMPGVAWPALPDMAGAAVLGLLFQLERSQWLTADALRALQMRQLGALLRHAWETVPYYRERWSRAPDADAVEHLPLLARREVQQHFAALRSERLPPGHGGVGESRTSGATGSPVRLLKSELSNLYWRAFTLRDHRWHGRDLGGKLAVIRQGATPGEAANWGPATDGLAATGPCVVLTPASSVDQQLDWLERQRPAYLLTYPSLLAELARASLARGLRLPGLREARSFGELLDPEVRQLCREAWGTPLTDMYSAQEVGYLALQCPEHPHYHVQAESALVEVLDDAGRACAPGQIGRVVVTDLHNFATPLLRYEIGDFAEVGEPCPCGRGLPVLRRIVGRTRGMLVTADGARYWPSFGVRSFVDIAPVLQHQFVQKSLDLIEARVVLAAPLTGEQHRLLGERILSKVPPGFRVQITCCDRIARSAGGKHEDFYSELSAAAR